MNLAGTTHRLAPLATLTGILLSACLLSGPALAERPHKIKLNEPGFTVERLKRCAFTDAVDPNFQAPLITAAACSPGGDWGESLFLAIHERWDDTARVGMVDASGKGTTIFGLGHHELPTHMAFSPPGWREGDLLLVTLVPKDWIDPSSRVLGWSPTGSVGTILGVFSPGSSRIGSVAVDSTGAFGGDLFFEWESQIYRQDGAGGVSVFSQIPPGQIRFGPGALWGTDLYSNGFTVAPDGTATVFPVPFESHDWAFGPGFDGDMFAVCGEREICRVKPDGTSTLFAEDVPAIGPVFCRGALWFVEGTECTAVKPKKKAPSTAPASP